MWFPLSMPAQMHSEMDVIHSRFRSIIIIIICVSKFTLIKESLFLSLLFRFLLMNKIWKWIIPSKEWTDSSETPQAKHVEESIWLEICWQQLPGGFTRDCGDNIKSQPSTCIPPCNLLWFINKKITRFVEVGNKEG